jgi:hypothetical protein
MCLSVENVDRLMQAYEGLVEAENEEDTDAMINLLVGSRQELESILGRPMAQRLKQVVYERRGWKNIGENRHVKGVIKA